MNNIKNFAMKRTVSARICTDNAMNKIKNALKDNSGMSHSVEVLLWALGAAVIVGAIIVLSISLMNDEVFPALSEKIKEILKLK